MDGSEVTMTQLVKTKNIYIAKFNNIVPGDYIAKVSVTDGDADLMITGACSFSFRHGFSPFPPSSINETIFTPSLGEKGFLSVELISEDTANDVKLLGVQIRDIDGNAVMNLTLNIANAKENLYVSDGFVAPDKAFKIAIVGAAENCGKKEIIRVTKSSIEPMNHSPGIFNQVPTIQKLEIITADKDTVSILCKASGYPKPKIIWKDRNGDTISNATAVDDDVTGKQITSILTMIEPEDNLFTCEATNDAGTDSDFIPLKLPRKPVIDKTIKEIVKVKGNEVEIFCSLKQGNPKPKISWYFMEDNDNEYVKLKYTSESLLIYNLGIRNSGSYKCEAVNSEGSDTYEMDLFISDPWEKKVKAYEGELVTLNCPGRPNRAQPSVRWFVDDREVVNGGRYHIHRNHSLSFKASTYDYGRYDCVSINRKKRERRKMFRLKIDPVLQFRNLN
ncbi:immunoglobulin superfamily member 10-like [Colias croceus]|uniref:immunoglobulin superfamily member 10-like n=1 Tax=Colias crocea TaxID=72248 RepID=UPI001E27ED3E|nr:immunoglobulin superfamily member 10-like [Colias croceus]